MNRQAFPSRTIRHQTPTENYRGHEDFWAARLQHAEPPQIPYARALAPPEVPCASKAAMMAIPPDVVVAWERRGEAGGMGDFMLAAFTAYLTRLTGRGHFDIALRDADMALALGYDASAAPYMPVRVDVEFEDGFYSAYQSTKEELDLARLHRPHFRAAASRHAFGHAGHPVAVELVARLPEIASAPATALTVQLPALGGACRWLHDPRILSTDAVDAMQRQFAHFLISLATDWRRPIAQLPLLTPEDRYELLVQWNATQRPFNAAVCLHELIEARAAETPGATALAFGEQVLSYEDLNAGANRIARLMRRLGVGPDVLVGICVPRSIELVTAIVATHKAGGACVPVDPLAGDAAVAHVLSDANPLVIIAGDDMDAQMPPHGTVISASELTARVSGETSDNLAVAMPPGSLAEVVYEIGSRLPEPPGVMLEHRNAVSLFASLDTMLDGGRPGVWLAIDAADTPSASLELLWPLTRGFVLVMHPEDWRPDAESAPDAARQIAARMRHHGVTHLRCTPSLARALLADDATRDVLRPLRKLLVAGEAFPARLAAGLKAVVSGDVLHLYGTPGTAACSAIHAVNGEIGAVPIGRPLPNTELYITDANREPVPVGIPGELLVGGAGVGRGYLNRPELTARRFIPHPFRADVSARLYRTGDLARYRADGTVELLGRLE